jgi:hypothetical protein
VSYEVAGVDSVSSSEKGATTMKLSPPKHVTWWIALVAGGVDVVEHYRVVHLPVIGGYSVFLIVGAWALLVLATALKGL